jgi:hypothetical protein
MSDITIPETMKAVRLHEPGGIDALSLELADRPSPRHPLI